jgi:hypothetical protein
MVVTNDVKLPSNEELTVPVEIKLSGAALRAGAFHLGKYCENENNVNRELGFKFYNLTEHEAFYFLGVHALSSRAR